MFRKIIIITAILFLVIGGKCNAASINLSDLSLRVAEGEEFEFQISVDEKEKSIKYLEFVLHYQSELFEFVSFDFLNQWKTVPGNRIDFLDSISGRVVRVGEKEGQAKIQEDTVATVKFRAIGGGVGIVRVGSDSILYDINSENVKIESLPSIVIVSGLKEEEAYFLFDINLMLDKQQVASLEELVARVVLVNFGNVFTPVSLSFNILNSKGKSVYKSVDYEIVETEKIFEKRFQGEKLPEGKYKLVLSSLYGADVRDEFTSDFEIVGKDDSVSKIFNNTKIFIYIGLVVLISIMLIIRARSKRGEIVSSNVEE